MCLLCYRYIPTAVAKTTRCPKVSKTQRRYADMLTHPASVSLASIFFDWRLYYFLILFLDPETIRRNKVFLYIETRIRSSIIVYRFALKVNAETSAESDAMAR